MDNDQTIADRLYPSTARTSTPPAPRVEPVEQPPAQKPIAQDEPGLTVNAPPATPQLLPGKPHEYKNYDPRFPEAHKLADAELDTSLVPDNIKELRDADPSRRLYDGSQDASAVPPQLVEMGADAAEWSRAMTDVGATREDLHTVSKLIYTEVSTPSDAQTTALWRQESEHYLRTHNVTPEDLAAARALYKRDVRVYRQLEVLKLGDHPAVVKRFIELARQFKNR